MPRRNNPSPPERTEPSTWEHFDLWRRLQEAIRALPHHFRSSTVIEGVRATDLFTLNSVLGAMIEEQVVVTLNELRSVRDPDKRYQAYSFVRQPQTYPDVLLRKRTNGSEILLGIELKGWYLLAKEGVPNFRFTATPAACNPWDLIVVVPWALSNVLSGSPTAYSPYIELAKYAAERRNYYWQFERDAQTDAGIVLSSHRGPYPAKSDQISDKAVSDSGGNFGRLARYGILGDYVAEMMKTDLRGLPVQAWLDFLKAHVG